MFEYQKRISVVNLYVTLDLIIANINENGLRDSPWCNNSIDDVIASIDLHCSLCDVNVETFISLFV